MIRVAIALACMAFPLLPVDARAAPAKSEKQIEKARSVMDAYAECVIRGNPAKSAEYVLANADRRLVRSRYRFLSDPSCLSQAAGGGAVMSASSELMKYAIAEALVSAQLRDSSISDFSKVPPLTHWAVPEREAYMAEVAKVEKAEARDAWVKSYDDHAAASWISRFGECVVRHSPAKAHAWLMSVPNSENENRRIEDMQPVFNDCLDEGTLKFNRITMRGTIAVNYYRLAKFAAVPALRGAN